ncbi:hypothetical protein AKO1_012256 [Acrasis kona]|uniref:ABC transporter domain-containing protein n=1 Tax=Acrasis kona TaxID=1008807 RepID=A0AAW2ZBI1_9EUKA
MSTKITKPILSLVNGVVLRVKQVYALLWKFVIYTKKHWISALIRLLTPCVIMLVLYFLNLKVSQIEASGKEPVTVPINRIPKGPGITLVYAPNNVQLTHSIMKLIAQKNDPPLTIQPLNEKFSDCFYDICGLSSYDDLSNAILNAPTQINGGIDFKFTETAGAFTIETTIWYNSTSFKRNPFIPFEPFKTTPKDNTLPIQRGLQEAMAEFILNEDVDVYSERSPSKTRQEQTPRKVTFDIGKKEYPTLAKTLELPKDIIVQLTGPIFFFLTMFTLIVTTHHSINSDRTGHLRLAMQHHDLKDISYWLSYLIWTSLYVFFSSLLVVCLGNLMGFMFFVRANFFVLWLLFYLLGVSLTVTTLLLSTFIRGPKLTNLATFVSLLIQLGLVGLFLGVAQFIQNTFNIGDPSLPPGMMFYNMTGLGFFQTFPAYNFAKATYDISTLAKPDPIIEGLPQVNTSKLVSGSDDFITFQNRSASTYYSFSDLVNTNLYNLTELKFKPDHYIPTTLATMSYMIYYIIGCFALTIILDSILPRTGQPGHSRWFGRRKDVMNVDVSGWDSKKFSSILPDTDADIVKEYQYVMNNFTNDQVALKVVKLSKMYAKPWFKRNAESKNALDNVTLGVSRNQVLVLLGHNGAGKSTLINILTGMLTASSGDAIINERSVVNEMGSIRPVMGVCAQEDLIFPELTGYQHMWLMASIRGISTFHQNTIIEQLLHQVKLHKHRHQVASDYSGGMKRRLSVAMCLLGDPSIMFLDEPTSGMDPVGKRLMWNLIREIRQDRVVVLSTHSMEEADSVGDKIAIMALGRLRAIGTPMHLKQRYGMGYTVSLTSTEKKLPQLKIKVLELFNVQNDKKSMMDVGLQLSSETSSTLTFTVYRISPQQMKLVSNFFHFLEEEKLQLQPEHVLVHDFVVSHTTLEDVFLRLTHGEGLTNMASDDESWDNEERMLEMQRTIKELEDTVTRLQERIQLMENVKN